MCHPVPCRQCGKTTWSGCGMHVQQVMANVPTNNRCEGHGDEPSSGGFFGRLLGRG